MNLDTEHTKFQDFARATDREFQINGDSYVFRYLASEYHKIADYLWHTTGIDPRGCSHTNQFAQRVGMFLTWECDSCGRQEITETRLDR